MYSSNETRGCIRFTFMGVPTMIRPGAWIMLLILGSSGTGMLNLQLTLFFVVAGMLCLLVHEYGHALMCRAMGGGSSVVEITSMGGVTQSSYPPATRAGHILMVLAGPGSTILGAALIGLLLGASIGSPQAGVVLTLLNPVRGVLIPDDIELFYHCNQVLGSALNSGALNSTALVCCITFSNVFVWWSLLNLLPILPLDGGQVLRLVTQDTQFTSRVSVVAGSVLFIICLLEGIIFGGIICAWLTYQNWQYLKMQR